MVQRRWLTVPDVQPGTGNAARPDRLQQPGLVVDAAARGADEDRARLHAREGRCIDHAAGGVIARTVQRHEIRPLEDLVELGGFGAAKTDFVAAQERIDGQHLHAEGMGECGDTAADVADADQPDRLARDLAAGEILARETPVAAQQPVAFGDTVRDGQDQP